MVNVNVEAAAPAAPTAQKLMELDYKPNSGYVDNRSKAVLDDVALKLQQDPNLNVVLSGSADSGEPHSMGLQRAQNAMAYLTKAKGIDQQRIQTKAATDPGRKVEVWKLPAGASLPGTAPAAAEHKPQVSRSSRQLRSQRLRNSLRHRNHRQQRRLPTSSRLRSHSLLRLLTSQQQHRNLLRRRKRNLLEKFRHSWRSAVPFCLPEGRKHSAALSFFRIIHLPCTA